MLLAAVLRFQDLPARGTWDADQGHDMLVLRGFVRDGVFPLLGPPTSIGDFHHGALYYYLLAPAAALSGADPGWVVGEIALLGVAAVAIVGWLARAVGGTAAGIAAGLLMVVSASAVDESTFLWNPNLVAFTSAVTVSAAWRAWSGRRPRWWLLAAAGAAATMQCHVLGITLLFPLVAWFLADVRRRAGPERVALVRVGLAGIVLIALSYTPLMVSELRTNFHESRAAIDFLVHGGQAVAVEPLVRIVFVTVRVLAWPLTGLATEPLAAGVVSAVLVIALLGWRLRAALGPERDLIRWLAGTVAFACLALGLGVAGLATVTPLPVDHYHAFLDPLVFVIVGLGVAAAWRGFIAGRSTAPRTMPAGRVVAVALVAILVTWNLARQPARAADGGYPAAAAAADRIMVVTGGSGRLASLPDFKTPEAYLFPLVRARGGAFVSLPGGEPGAPLVVVCDALFVKDCGGPAEDPLAAATFGSTPVRLSDRFLAAPGRTISVYRAGSP